MVAGGLCHGNDIPFPQAVHAQLLPTSLVLETASRWRDGDRNRLYAHNNRPYLLPTCLLMAVDAVIGDLHHNPAIRDRKSCNRGFPPPTRPLTEVNAVIEDFHH